MKSVNPEEHERVQRVLERRAEGEEVDPATGRKLDAGVPEGLEEVELEPEDMLWVTLFEEIQGALTENGLPVPREEDHVLSVRWGIRDQENLRFCRGILREMCYGRNEGLNAKVEPPKKGKSGKP